MLYRVYPRLMETFFSLVLSTSGPTGQMVVQLYLCGFRGTHQYLGQDISAKL